MNGPLTLHWPLLLPTLSGNDRAWPACYLESRNQPRNLVDKAGAEFPLEKEQLAGIIVDKQWNISKQAVCLHSYCQGPQSSCLGLLSVQLQDPAWQYPLKGDDSELG